MQKLLHWLLANPLRAGVAAAALAMSRIFDIFGAALAATTTLRSGVVAGLQLVAVALPLLWLAGQASGIGNSLLLAELGLWLPVIGVSVVLRRTGSLALMMQAAAALAGLGVAAWYVADPQPMATMLQFVEEHLLPVYGQLTGSTPSLDDAAKRELAGVMPAALAVSSMAMVIIATLLGRWLQAVAFNPGGFRMDFHALRQGRSLVVLVIALWVVVIAVAHPVLIALAALASGILVFQGLALAHGVVAIRKAKPFWLWVLYGMMLFLPLQVCTLLMVTGAMDNWIDWRRHVDRSGEA